MVDDHSPSSAFGLDAFAHVIDNIGVEVWDVREHDLRGAGRGQAGLFAGQPFIGGVGAQMDHGISLKFVLQPQVGGNILVMGV